MKTRSVLPKCLKAMLPAGVILGVCTLAHSPLRAADAPPPPKAPEPEVAKLESAEADPFGPRPARRELPWLGVSAEEAPESLTAQLGLEPGVGLVVEYVSEDSPVGKAGLKKNDLLVEFEGQSLVHPAQLRKLVQARKEGDVVKLTYYRAGKKETLSTKLAAKAVGLGLAGEEGAWRGDLRELQRQLRDVPWGDEFQRRMEAFRETLREQFGPDQRRAIGDQVREAVEQGRRAAAEAVRMLTNSGTRELRQALEELERAKVGIAPEARVTVNRSSSDVKSMVHSDDTGTYVLISNPTAHLTVHAKDGKLVFDGPVETPEERGQVPKEILEKVQPMLEKLAASPDAGAPRANPAPKRGSSF